MRTSFSETLLQLLQRLGLSTLWIQLGVWLLALAVAVMGIGSIFLAAIGLGWVNGFGLVLWMIFILGVKFSPVLWAGTTGTAVAVAQPGGEKGLSAADALKKVKEWSPGIMGWLDKNFVFWVPAWLLYTTLFSTAGMVKWNILLFVLIPTLVWFSDDEWPGGKLVRRLIGYTLVIGATLIVGFTIYNTMTRVVADVVADPGVPQYQSYLDDLKADEKKNVQEVVETIIAKMKAGKELTELDKAIVKRLEELAPKQRLNPANVKTVIESARPADSSWWKANWHWVALVALALYGATRIWKAATRSTMVTASGEVVSSAGHGATAKRSFAMSLLGLAVLAVVGWFAYSYLHRYDGEDIDLFVTDLRDQRHCDFNFPAGKKLQFTPLFPDNNNNRGEIVVTVHDGETLRPFDLATFLRVDKAIRGRAFLPKDPTGKCLDFTFAVPEARKGTPITNNNRVGRTQVMSVRITAAD